MRITAESEFKGIHRIMCHALSTVPYDFSRDSCLVLVNVEIQIATVKPMY